MEKILYTKVHYNSTKKEEKLSTSQLIMVQHKKLEILSFSTRWVGLSKKTILCYCLFKYTEKDFFPNLETSLSLN